MSPVRWRTVLPLFDRLKWCRKEQLRTANSFRNLNFNSDLIRHCSVKRPCRSGLCASCIRRLRIRLLDFLAAESLDLLSWHFVTIRVEGWKIEAGNCRPFGRLRDHPLIENLITKLRRMNIPGLIVFGSIETVYVTVANIPGAKVFHLHLMIAGATEAQIREAVQRTIPLDANDVLPLQIIAVPLTAGDFFKVASYAFKQPLVKKSRRSADQSRGIRQRLKAAERRELILNYGVHGWTGRLILVGIRCDGGKFRLTANLSVTQPSAVSEERRELLPRQHRRPPQGQGS